MDEQGVQVFQIGPADKLGYIGFVTDIPFFIRIRLSPLTGGKSEKCHVQDVRFFGVYPVDLGSVQLGRNQVSLMASVWILSLILARFRRISQPS